MLPNECSDLLCSTTVRHGRRRPDCDSSWQRQQRYRQNTNDPGYSYADAETAKSRPGRFGRSMLLMWCRGTDVRPVTGCTTLKHLHAVQPTFLR